MIIVIGFKEHAWDAKPQLVYLGKSSDEAEKAIAKTEGKDFVRLGKIVHPALLTVSAPNSVKIVREPDIAPKLAADSSPPEQPPAPPTQPPAPGTQQ